MIKKLFITFILSILVFRVHAQGVDSLLFTYHYDANKGIMLKWIPTSYDVMLEGFKNGFELYRAEAVKTGGGGEKLLPFEKLNSETIKHWTMDQIKEGLAKDSALVTPGLIFNDEENLYHEGDIPIDQALDKARAREFMLMWAVSSAVTSNNVASAMGMFYTDVDVNVDKKYVYKLEINGHPEWTNHIIVFPVKGYELEKVSGLSHTLEHGAVTLKWFNNDYEQFTYFDIYRSTKKNKDFIKLNKQPYSGVFGNMVKNTNITTFLDSIPEYNKTYYYKVIGTNAFEAECRPSDVLEVQAYYLLQSAPRINSIETGNGNEVTLEWEQSSADLPYIRGFNIFRADNGEGPYQLVNSKLLSSKNFSYTDKGKKWVSNYYRICSYNEIGDSTCSLLKFHPIVDSIPPSAPRIVVGKCDSSGVVKICWNLPPENDVSGYRIFKSYIKNAEPVRLYPGEIFDTLAYDTISLDEPYNKIFYRVSAVDHMANPSPPSDFFEVLIPDINPPVNGFIRDYEVSKEGIKLLWQNSNAYDLDKMYLLRKDINGLAYDTILDMQVDNLLESYLDYSTKSGMVYTYALLAQDQAGLYSKLSGEVTIKQFNKEERPSPTNLQAFVSKPNGMIKLVWEYPYPAEGFRILRAGNDGQLKTYAFVNGRKREYYDKTLTPNSKYKYMIMAEMPNNYTSGVSNTIEVNY